MKRVPFYLLIAAVVGVLFALPAGSGPRSTRRNVGQTNGLDALVRGVVMVKLQRGVRPEGGMLGKNRIAISTQLQSAGVQTIQRAFPAERELSDLEILSGRADLSTWYRALIDPAADPAMKALDLVKIQGVEVAEPKFINFPLDVPNDSLYPGQQQPYFEIVHAPAGWSLAKGDTGVVIAVVDGGTFWQHPDIQPSLYVNPVDGSIGWNFANNSNDPRGLPIAPNVAEHGTETASVAAAATNNSIGIAGASWGCRLMPICASASDRDNAIAYGFEGIQYAFSHGATIINCSWGRQGTNSQFEQDIITAALQAGALVVVAAANNNDDVDFTPWYPTAYSGVLAVGATLSNSDVKAPFSNYGVSIPVYAPGTGIWAATNTGTYTGFLQGTSFSSPLVAGLAGIVKSAHRTWTPLQIMEQIRMTADSIDGVNFSYAGSLGRGRVNFARALSETPSGIVVARESVTTPSGGSVFLPGDTIIVRLAIKNVLQPAQNLSVTVSATESALTPLQGAFSVPLMNTDDSVNLPDAMFVLGQVSTVHQTLVKVSWVANGHERDQRGFPIYLFPVLPTWNLQAKPVANSLFSVRAVDTNIIWSAGGDGFGTAPVVVRTTNGGRTWKDVTANLSGVDLYCITAVDGAHAWVGTGDGRIYATTNGGTSWQSQPYPGQQSPFINAIWFFDGSNGYAHGDPGASSRYVFLSTTDGGASWSQSATEPASAQSEVGWLNAFWWVDPQHGWFGSNRGVVYRTTDGGGTWSSSASGGLNSVSLAFRSQSNGIVAHDNGALSVTSDGGASWSSITSPTASPIFGTAFLSGTHDAWFSDISSIYHSTDDGHTWAAQSVYPVVGQIDHISFVDTTHGWGVTSAGEILQNFMIGPTIPPPPELPGSYALYQNYPNPFNNGTFISYDLPVRSNVTIVLYDILGRRIRTLLSGLQGPGRPSPFHLDASGLASGVYIFRITAIPIIQNYSTFQSAKKMVLIR